MKLVRQRRPPEDVVAWLYRVVRNGALDAAKIARRRRGRESAAARPVRWFVEPEVDGLDAEIAVAALERPPAPEQREVIVAHHWGGLSFEQVATVVGCSASTAFRRYTAGVEVLRKLLGVTCPNRSSNDWSRFTPIPAVWTATPCCSPPAASSARPNRGWMTLASLLAGTQALSLALLWPHSSPSVGRSTVSIAGVPAPSAAPGPPATGASADPGLWPARHGLLRPEAVDHPAGDVTFIESEPPLRAFPPPPSLLN